MEFLERRTAITGIGQSQIGKRLGRDPLDLTLDACLAGEAIPAEDLRLAAEGQRDTSGAYRRAWR